MNVRRMYSSSITSREKEVLCLIAEEHSTKEIASKLFISDHTVISHRKSLMEKMGAKNTAGLVRRGFEYGVLRIATYCMVLLFCGSAVSVEAQRDRGLKADEEEEQVDPIPPQTIGLEVAEAHAVLFGDSLYGGGNKVIWLPQIGAFRAGESRVRPVFLVGNEELKDYSWDSLNIGEFSTGFGVGNFAEGRSSMAWGEQNLAKGQLSTALGFSNRVDSTAFVGTAWGLDNKVKYQALYGTAWGNNNGINAPGTTVWGMNNSVDSSSAEYATIWGEENSANGELATTWGRLNKASGAESTAWGVSNEAAGIGTTAIGSNNEVDGFRASAIGFGLINRGAVSLSVGQYNDPLLDQSEDAAGIILKGTPLFAVGNGGPLERSNALTVMDNGRVKIGNDLPQADLHIKSSENSDGESTGGIRIESEENGNYWQVTYSPTGKLNFIKNGTREAYVGIDGSWNQLIDFPLMKNGDVSKKIKKAPLDITQIELGVANASSQKIEVDAHHLLQEMPSLITKDESGKPVAINYQQINLIALQTIKDQVVELESLKRIVQNLAKEVEELNANLDR